MHEAAARLLLALSVAASGLAGCFLDRTPLATEGSARDGGRRDAGGGDAGGSRDAGPRDGGRDAGRDAGAPDTGPPDTGPPDTGPPDAGPPSCDSLYGAAPGYMLCEERARECELVSQLDGMRTCGTTCAALGGRCIDAYRNEVPFPPCERQGPPIGCDQLHIDDICICSRGP